MTVNMDLILATAEVMQKAWVNLMRDKGYHHGMEHSNDDIRCGKCHPDVLEWSRLSLDQKAPFIQMAGVALQFLQGIKYYG